MDVVLPNHRLFLEGSEFTYVGEWSYLDNGAFQITVNNRVYKFSGYLNLSKDIVCFLKVLGRKILHDRLKLVGCLTCTHFYCSGMALDMRNGEVGSCKVHSRLVDICYCCKNYSSSVTSDE